MPASSPDKRIRGRKLQAIRARVLRSNPLCVSCLARGITRPATQVDHIVALCNDGEESDANRQGLCDDCHAIKTAADLGNSIRTGYDESGAPTDAGHHWNR